ncbi:hypothetical protein FALBO_13305 [Fusarium albosuccineum]|uniref:Uncharacterized protein n=1 Tax=Fusarium albosuccineum TaxID=1237068 RepID=A0A8H4PGH4_9HYPO|nr:hypothetical protein FALBO_13305 [Fusarium albosuccineum]
MSEFDRGVEVMRRMQNINAAESSSLLNPTDAASIASDVAGRNVQSPSCYNTERSLLSDREGNGRGPNDLYDAVHADNMSGQPHSHTQNAVSHHTGDRRHRRFNPKYTTEEGDFIIYALHDKKMKWQQIHREFNDIFGNKYERTLPGLQAWYYRMNQRIPVWDEDGFLCFENEDDLEPRQESIKCWNRGDQERDGGSLGLGQRYPERAVTYHWVDAELRARARDWATKRTKQYQQREAKRAIRERQSGGASYWRGAMTTVMRC